MKHIILIIFILILTSGCNENRNFENKTIKTKEFRDVKKMLESQGWVF